LAQLPTPGAEAGTPADEGAARGEGEQGGAQGEVTGGSLDMSRLPFTGFSAAVVRAAGGALAATGAWLRRKLRSD
jgi:hypothetical protein